MTAFSDHERRLRNIEAQRAVGGANGRRVMFCSIDYPTIIHWRKTGELPRKPDHRTLQLGDVITALAAPLHPVGVPAIVGSNVTVTALHDLSDDELFALHGGEVEALLEELFPGWRATCGGTPPPIPYRLIRAAPVSEEPAAEPQPEPQPKNVRKLFD